MIPAVDPFAQTDEFVAQTFKRLLWRGGRTADKTFERCTFSKCTFAESIFEGCTFRECIFTDCACRFVHFPKSRFVGVKFDKCDMTYVNWAEGIWPKTGAVSALAFTECNISHSTFIGLALKKFMLSKCTAHNADFAEADLAQAVCTDTDFAESRFHNTNLSEADFSRAINYAISPLTNKIKHAKFSVPQALSLLAAFEIVLDGYESL